MPISDSYFVQSLLQSTLHPGSQSALHWAAKESEGFRAELNGVHLDLDSVPTRSGPQLYLTLTRDGQRAYVQEPVNTGFFMDDYLSESHRELAHLLRALFCAVAEQCAEQERVNGANPAREALFRLALFGKPDGQGSPKPAYQPGLG